MVVFAALLAMQAQDEALAFVTRNLVNGGPGNFFAYARFSEQGVTLRQGDTLVYRIFQDPANPEPKGGVDANLDRGPALRELELRDQDGVIAHPNGILTKAIGKWHERRIPLDALANRTVRE